MSTLLRPSSLPGALAVIALCALAPGLMAQRTHPTPAPVLAVEWGVTAESLVVKAAEGGWEFLGIDEDGDYTFGGRLDGAATMVFATIGASGLTRLLVSVHPHRAADETFSHLVDTVRAHFGPAEMVSGEETGLRPAPSLVAATAWKGVLMGLRRDRRIIMVFTCPASSPALPTPRGRLTSA